MSEEPHPPLVVGIFIAPTDAALAASDMATVQAFLDDVFGSRWQPKFFKATPDSEGRELRKLIRELEKGALGGVAFLRLDDMGNFMTLRRIWVALRKLNAPLFCVEGPIHTGDPATADTLDLLVTWLHKLNHTRTHAGIAAARAHGHTLGRPPLSPAKLAKLKELAATLGPKPRAIARVLGISHPTVISYLRELKLR